MGSIPCDGCKYRETKKCIGCAMLEKYLASQNLSVIDAPPTAKKQTVPFEEEFSLN